MTDPAADVEQDAGAMTWCTACDQPSRVVVDIRHRDQVVATLTGCQTCRTGIYHPASP